MTSGVGVDQAVDATPFAASDGTPTYSIKREFAGATVMITGASGYIGSLVMEQLLRTTDVAKIYVLIRGKRGTTAQERLAQLLQKGLFHLVRDNPRLLAKVELLEGDLNSDDLGLTQRELQLVQANVNILVHSAASIQLEADVQHTLRSNYLGTRRLLALATQMRALRGMVHVSTAYVNVNFPRGSTVDERIFPLHFGGQEVHHADIVDDLMSLKPAAANVRAQMFLDMWGFPNTYTLGKNLTEKLVATYHKQHGLNVAIVRPSLVTGLAGLPYPGYCGNVAGPIGMGIAMAVGLFDRLESVAMVPTHVWDAVPGDVVSGVILAAAAATAARMAINEYAAECPAAAADPMIVHAGTSTTYPISFCEAFYAGLDFVRQNPPPVRLPGASLFSLPLDYRPNEEAVKRCKYWTGWKVWAAVKLLNAMGMYGTARQLHYGYLGWEIQNSTKTDRNLFFASKNLLQLEAQLDAGDAGSGDYKTSWTIRNGGWPRYISTNIAGMWRQVFKVKEVKGLEDNDFKFIANRSVRPGFKPDTAKASNDHAAPLLPAVTEGDEEDEQSQEDMLSAGFRGTAAAFQRIPASGNACAASESAESLAPAGADDDVPLRGDTPGLFKQMSAKLGQSLSYKAASMSDLAQGNVSGGMLATLSKPMQRLSRSATPAVRRDKDV